MFDAPLDAWYVWLGVSAASLAMLGVAVSLPTATAPDAVAVADGIDAVAASPHDATGTVSVEAKEIRLGSTRLSLRGSGGTSHATVAFGPVVPVRDGRLRRVLDGIPPGRIFASATAFGEALAERRVAEHRWRPAPAKLRIRRVTWGDVDATLVG